MRRAREYFTSRRGSRRCSDACFQIRSRCDAGPAGAPTPVFTDPWWWTRPRAIAGRRRFGVWGGGGGTPPPPPGFEGAPLGAWGLLLFWCRLRQLGGRGGGGTSGGLGEFYIIFGVCYVSWGGRVGVAPLLPPGFGEGSSGGYDVIFLFCRVWRFHQTKPVIHHQHHLNPRGILSVTRIHTLTVSFELQSVLYLWHLAGQCCT